MKIKKSKIKEMIAQLDAIRKEGKELEKRYSVQLSKVHPSFRKSAVNLLHYLALRHQDIQGLQNRLGNLGVSRLGRAESHVMASVLAVRNILRQFTGSKKLKPEKVEVSIKKGGKVLRSNTKCTAR